RCRIPQSALGSSLRPFQVAAGVRVAKFQYEQASASLPECSMLMRHDAVRPGEAAVNGAASKPLIALTGATGFIGKFLLRELPKLGYRLRVLLRRPSALSMESASAVVGDLARPQNMAAALADVGAVIHSAGLAHAMSGLPEDDYRMLNTEATIRL